MSTIWHLRPKADRRFRAGHPWIYSNELAESPKGIEPGEQVELRDADDKFLARGYGNPSSLIAFRVLTRESGEKEPVGQATLRSRLEAARALRERVGLGEVSYRLCFGEADSLPGLVIDRYRLESGGDVLAVQAHTAGSDRILPAVRQALLQLYPGAAIVFRNDVGVRKLEGLEEREPEVVEPGSGGVDLRQASIRVGAVAGQAPAIFKADLVHGQKTGFFLDQVSNVALAARLLVPPKPAPGAKRVRILDLCCYVGQWSSQLTRAYRAAGFEVDVVAVDASASALELARANILAAGASSCEALKGDVLKDLDKLDPQSFDLIVSDPPALIKGRKNIPAGTHGYLQLNTQVFRLAKPGAAVVCCSCSALLPEEDFLATLAKAARRNQRQVRWIARGSQSPDHPMLAEFPEGRYLKCWIGVC